MNMKKAKQQKPKPTVKYEKPLKLDMSFDEAIRRIVRVKPMKKK
jgi:hypothetical protein